MFIWKCNNANRFSVRGLGLGDRKYRLVSLKAIEVYPHNSQKQTCVCVCVCFTQTVFRCFRQQDGVKEPLRAEHTHAHTHTRTRARSCSLLESRAEESQSHSSISSASWICGAHTLLEWFYRCISSFTSSQAPSPKASITLFILFAVIWGE